MSNLFVRMSNLRYKSVESVGTALQKPISDLHPVAVSASYKKHFSRMKSFARTIKIVIFENLSEAPESRNTACNS